MYEDKEENLYICRKTRLQGYMQHKQYGVGVQLSMGKQDRLTSAHYLQA